MNEQIDDNQEYLEHHPDAIQDIEEAHALAERVDELESERAAYVGGMALIGNSYAAGKPVDSYQMQRDAGEATMSRLVSAHGVEADTVDGQRAALETQMGAEELQTAIDNSPERRAALGADAIVRGWREANSTNERIASEEDLKAAATAARKDIDIIDGELAEVYAGGLTPEEKARQKRQEQADKLTADLRKRS